MDLHQRFRLTFLVAIGLVSSLAPPRPSPQAPPAVDQQAALLAAVNAARARNGRAPLALHPALSAAAAWQASACAARGTLTHVGPDGSWPWDRAARFGYGSRNVSEDAAAGQTSAAQAAADWMNDKPHRTILLGPWTQMGGAMARGKVWGNYWFVDFGTPGPAAAPLPLSPEGGIYRRPDGSILIPGREKGGTR